LSEKKTLMFDPDKFVLTKDHVLRILDNIEDRWSKNKKHNLPLLMELKGAKFYFRIKSEKAISELWSEIIKEVNEIMITNSVKVTKDDQNKSLEVFEKIRAGKLK